MTDEVQICELWIAWIAEGETFQARWNGAPSNVEQFMAIRYCPRPGTALGDSREYMRLIEAGRPATKQGGDSGGPGHVFVHSLGPGDTFCTVSYMCHRPPETPNTLKAFLRYNAIGRMACVAIPNPRFGGLALEASPGEIIDTVDIESIAGDRTEWFITGAPPSSAPVHELVRAIVSKYARQG